MVENEHGISRLNPFFEARLDLRKHHGLDAAIMARVIELPEEDFCDRSRESFQLGAGYAYSQMDDAQRSQLDEDTNPLRRELNAEEILDVFEIFFAIQPQNRYLYSEEIEQQRKEIMFAALHPAESHPADSYEVEAAAAFLEGYALVKTYQRFIER